MIGAKALEAVGEMRNRLAAIPADSEEAHELRAQVVDLQAGIDNAAARESERRIEREKSLKRAALLPDLKRAAKELERLVQELDASNTALLNAEENRVNCEASLFNARHAKPAAEKYPGDDEIRAWEISVARAEDQLKTVLADYRLASERRDAVLVALFDAREKLSRLSFQETQLRPRQKEPRQTRTTFERASLR